MKGFVISVILALLYTAATSAGEKLSASTRYALKKIAGNGRIGTRASFPDNAETPYMGLYIVMEEGADPQVFGKYGAAINMVLDSIASVRLPADSVYSLAADSRVRRIDSGYSPSPETDVARECVNADRIVAGEGLPYPFDGKGVVIGIIDRGMQFDHIGFFNSENKLRIKRVWLQSERGTPPENFSYGNELTDEASIIAHGTDVTSETHATAVAGIAAGSNKGLDYYGMATESDIVYVSYSTSLGDGYACISDAVKYIFDYADMVDKPCVINLSLGDTPGPHDGNSLFDKVCDAMQGAGRLITGAAGNDGNSTGHIAAVIASPQDTLKTFFSFIGKYGNGYKSTSNFYGEPGKEFGIRLCVLQYGSGNIIAESEPFSSSDAGTFTCRFSKAGYRGMDADIDIFCDTEPGSGRPHITIDADMPNVTAGYSLGIRLYGDNGTVHGWSDNKYSQFKSFSTPAGWSAGDNNCTANEIGGVGKRIISVGSYKSKEFSSSPSSIGGISSFSSRGPTADGRMKPDITAPGEWVVSSYSEAVINNISYSARLKEGDSLTVGNRKYVYGSMSGTSAATPVVTGTLALWLQACPDLTPEDVREVLSRTAVRDGYTGDTPGNTWGYGKLDAWGGLKEVLKLSSLQSHRNDTREPATLIRRGKAYSLLIAEGMENAKVDIYDISGRKAASVPGREIAAGDEIPLPQLPDGIYVISLTGNGVFKSFKLAVN